MEIEIVKTHSETTTIKLVALNMFDVAGILKARKERRCWNCENPFEKSEGGRLSLAMTNRLNKFICTHCAKMFIAQGVPCIDRTPKESTPGKEQTE